MQSKSVSSNSHLSLPFVNSRAKVWSAIIVGLLLSACGGGISGTGDGGIIQPTNSQSTDAIDSTGNTAEIDSGTDAGIADGADQTPQSPTADNANLPIPDLALLAPETLLQTNSRNEGTSATVSFTTQLLALAQEAAETSNAISMADTTQLDITPVDIALPNEISNQFTSTLSFSIDGTDTVVASSDANELRFFFSNNTQRAIHLLQQGNTITVRRVDRISNSVFQATIVSLPDSTNSTATNSTAIRADLNVNGVQTYLESYSTAEFTAAFTQHPTDPTIPRQRELIDPVGAVLVLQNCTGLIADCISDGDFSNTDADVGMQFSSAAQTIANALSEPVNSPASALPDGVNEAVLTASDINQPTEDQIQCGLQRVDNNIRLFCLRPVPLASDVGLFSETVSGAEILYQLLE